MNPPRRVLWLLVAGVMLTPPAAAYALSRDTGCCQVTRGCCVETATEACGCGCSLRAPAPTQPRPDRAPADRAPQPAGPEGATVAVPFVDLGLSGDRALPVATLAGARTPVRLRFCVRLL